MQSLSHISAEPSIVAICATNSMEMQRPEDTDALSMYGTMQGSPVEVDRFGYLNQFSPWRCTGLDSVPQVAASDSSEAFSDICSTVAKKFLATGKQLYVSYSGGVDSLCIMASFIREADNPAQITCLYNNASIDEYPDGITKLDNYGVTLQSIEGDVDALAMKRAAQDGLLITGFCADQLYGSDVNLRYPQWFHKDWTDFILTEKGTQYQPAIDQFEASFQHYGMPIKNFAQFAWWMNFSSKWQTVKYWHRFLAENEENVQHFYEDPLFQEWSMARFGRVDAYHPSDTVHYKPESKHVINEVFHDMNYCTNKGKVGSYSTVLWSSMVPGLGIRDTERMRTTSLNMHFSSNRAPSVRKRIMNAMLPEYRK